MENSSAEEYIGGFVGSLAFLEATVVSLVPQVPNVDHMPMEMAIAAGMSLGVMKKYIGRVEEGTAGLYAVGCTVGYLASDTIFKFAHYLS